MAWRVVFARIQAGSSTTAEALAASAVEQHARAAGHARSAARREQQQANPARQSGPRCCSVMRGRAAGGAAAPARRMMRGVTGGERAAGRPSGCCRPAQRRGDGRRTECWSAQRADASLLLGGATATRGRRAELLVGARDTATTVMRGCVARRRHRVEHYPNRCQRHVCGLKPWVSPHS